MCRELEGCFVAVVVPLIKAKVARFAQKFRTCWFRLTDASDHLKPHKYRSEDPSHGLAPTTPRSRFDFPHRALLDLDQPLRL